MKALQERERLMTEALWQAYYHGELDDLDMSLHHHTIDGNDHPVLRKTAKAIVKRLQENLTSD
jgi:hypothetical protein